MLPELLFCLRTAAVPGALFSLDREAEPYTIWKLDAHYPVTLPTERRRAMSESTYWIVFGDIHDDVSRLADIPELPGAAGVIVTGDITFLGGIKQAEKILAPLAGQTPVLLAQIGNMDKAEITSWLDGKGWNLHREAREIFPGIVAFGVGCSPLTPFNTPSEHPENQIAAWLEEAREKALHISPGNGKDTSHAQGLTEARMVLVSHSPPYASACDRLRDGTPVGSTAVREFIEKHQPDICLCGHIHESRAQERIGRTHVLNPGTLPDGGYILLHLERTAAGPEVRAELKQL
jgi:Predicted phosphoesterases, related to the Icc protein